MAARKYESLVEPKNVRPKWRMRLVQDGDAPVVSPALLLQDTLSRAALEPGEHYERYPLAFRVALPLIASAGLWFLILRLI